ncbi:nucleolin [Cinclus cinclus]|uniref:nucleolin n=1 Tax=Cinclus cinclus TaxID=127875 RepID=UPI002E0E91E8
MVKITKTPKNQIKQKKMAPPPKKFEESEEEESSDLEESSGEEIIIPQKKPQKVAVTPAKKAATPAKKVATPAKKAITPAKKVVATPQPKKAVAPTPKKAAVLTKGAKNGKNAKKEESEEEDDEDDDDDEEEDDEEDDSDEEEEPPMPVKPTAKKPAAVPAKKPAAVPAKQESEEEDEDEDEDEEDDEEDESEDEAMDTAPVPVKKTTPAKAAPVKAKAAESDDEEDEEEDDDEDDDEEEDEEDAEEESEDEKPVKEAPGKRKKEMASKSAPEPKKKKTDGPTSAFSMYVSNLACTKEFDELKTGLREFFGKKNIEILDVRIGASKRFGYVDFSSAEDLDKALQMNGKKLMGLEIKLEKAKSKETMKENKKERDARTLFLKNLPYRLTEDEIREVFENALEVRIVMNKDGNSKGMAYVEFKTEAEANKALEEKQGTEIEGRAVVIDFTGEKSQQEHHKGEPKTLIVNNLSYAATEETLQEVFKKASSIKVPQNNQGRPKGYAFVDFATAEDAKEALNSYNNTEIEGRTIRLEFSTPSWQKGNTNARGGGGGGGFNQQSKTLFVRGLSEDTTEETLRESFEGSISARIVTDRDTGSSKGFGFVDFSSAEDAKAAKEAMEDGEIDGNKVILDFAKPKGEFQRGGGFGGRGGRGGGRGGRGGFGGRGGGRGGFGGRGGGFRGGRGGGGDHKPQGKKIKFE